MSLIKKLKDLVINKNSERAKYRRREEAYRRLWSMQAMKYLKENKPWEKACEKAANNGDTHIVVATPTLIPRHRKELAKIISDQGFDMVFWKKIDGEWCLVIDWRERYGYGTG